MSPRALRQSAPFTGLRLAQAGVLLALGLLAGPGWAQSNTALSSAAPASAHAVNPAGPRWLELGRTQQVALQPLASRWDQLSVAQKRKWIALSHNYASLSAEQQAVLHSRMAEWVALSPQQRAQARLSFAETTQIAPDDKKAKWQAYQALSEEEKQRLAHRSTKPSGAATAVKPVPAQKLVAVPAPKSSAPRVPKIVTSPKNVDRHTLLPQPAASAPAAVAPPVGEAPLYPSR